MKITIDTKVLQEEHLTVGEFLVMLMGFYHERYSSCYNRLENKGTICIDVFNALNDDFMMLSDNTKNLITSILVRSDPKVRESKINFMELAGKLQDLYPSGNKPGTTYPWREDRNIIAQKLMTLVAVHEFSFTEEEAVRATKEYVDSYDGNYGQMQLLRYFILKTKNGEVNSMFMTLIENNR